MIDFFYMIIIQPIELLIEFLFNNFWYYSLENLTLTIFLISFVVSLLCLPLYLRADKLQEEENEIQKKLSNKINIIKKYYKGDERQFLLQTYYKQNNYHPIMGLRLSISLLLQIPIFIAAYNFFSHLSLLHGASYLFINNMATPDELLSIGNIHINILPVFMTIINIHSGLIYTNDKSFKENRVLIIISLVFLVLLYNAPSALVLYWIFNNIFSLIKNICMRAYNEKKSKFNIADFLNKIKSVNININCNNLFICSMIACWVLLGIFIPSEVISSDPEKFVLFNSGPVDILFFAICIFAGIFLFWGMVIYKISNTLFKKIFSVSALLLFIFLLVNFLFIKLPKEALSNTLTFDEELPEFSNYLLLNKWLWLSVMIMFIVFALLLVWKNKVKVINQILILTAVSGIIVSGWDFVNILNQMSAYNNAHNSKKTDFNSDEYKYIKLSKTKKNVLIIFIDKAISSYFPIALEEDTNLKNEYEGFTYYPNTFSYGGHSILGYMPILGGYEYTPFRMDERKDSFADMYMEALTVLPTIFYNNNWTTSIINPQEDTWSFRQDVKSIFGKAQKNIFNTDYRNEPNLTVKNIPNDIKSYLSHTQIDYNIAQKNSTKRNIIYFSFLSATPSSTRTYIYNKGSYHIVGYNNTFLNSTTIKDYLELYFMDKFTDFSQKNNTFTVFNNELTHSPQILNYPNYDLSGENDTSYYSPMKNNDETTIRHYHVNMATYKLLGKYMDFLKNNHAYDNTRIIIVADHGWYNLNNPYWDKFYKDYYMHFNPLLLVKDFNQRGELKIDNTVMTNGDVPIIATKNLINEPTNPYTHKRLTNKDKEYGIIVKKDFKWQPQAYTESNRVCQADDKYYYVKGNPMDKNNWIVDMNYNEALKLFKEKFPKI